MDRENLIDSVIAQISADLELSDATALGELLEHLSDDVLEGYLEEE
jgi:hypothetical protein